MDSPVYLPSNALVVTNKYISAGFEVVNNRIRNIISRGILTKSHQGMIRGNTVENVGQSGIGLLSEASYWLEGPFNQDIRIVDNRLDRNCISINSRIYENANGSIAVEVEMHGDPEGKYFNKNILIRNNTISRSGTSAITVKNTEGVDVYGNTLIHPMAEEPYLNRNTYGIHLFWTSGIKVGENEFLQPSRWMTKEVAYGPLEE